MSIGTFTLIAILSWNHWISESTISKSSYVFLKYNRGHRNYPTAKQKYQLVACYYWQSYFPTTWIFTLMSSESAIQLLYAHINILMWQKSPTNLRRMRIQRYWQDTMRITNKTAMGKWLGNSRFTDVNKLKKTTKAILTNETLRFKRDNVSNNLTLASYLAISGFGYLPLTAAAASR